MFKRSGKHMLSLFPTIEDEELLRFFTYPGYIKGKNIKPV